MVIVGIWAVMFAESLRRWMPFSSARGQGRLPTMWRLVLKARMTFWSLEKLLKRLGRHSKFCSAAQALLTQLSMTFLGLTVSTCQDRCPPQHHPRDRVRALWLPWSEVCRVNAGGAKGSLSVAIELVVLDEFSDSWSIGKRHIWMFPQRWHYQHVTCWPLDRTCQQAHWSPQSPPWLVLLGPVPQLLGQFSEALPCARNLLLMRWTVEHMLSRESSTPPALPRLGVAAKCFRPERWEFAASSISNMCYVSHVSPSLSPAVSPILCLPLLPPTASHFVSLLVTHCVSHFVFCLVAHCVSHGLPLCLPLCVPLCLPPCCPLCLPLSPTLSSTPSHTVFPLSPTVSPSLSSTLSPIVCVPPLCLPACPHCVSHFVSRFVSQLVSRCVSHFVSRPVSPTFAPRCLPLCVPPCHPLCLPLCLCLVALCVSHGLHFVFHSVSHCVFLVSPTFSPTLSPSLSSTLFQSIETRGGLPSTRVPWTLKPCLSVVFQLSPSTPSCPPDVVYHLSSTCVPVVSLSPRCLPLLSHNFPQFPLSLTIFHLSPSCLPVVFLLPSTCPPVVSQLSLRCLSDMVSKMLSPSCLRGLSTCCLLVVVFHVSLRCCLPRYGLSTCFPVASQMWSSKSLLFVSLSVDFETVTAVGFES